MSNEWDEKELGEVIDNTLRKRGYMPEKTAHENYMRACFSSMYRRIYLEGWNDCMKEWWKKEGDKE